MKTLFLWPQEPFLPTSLFKHYVYMGETAASAKKAGSDVVVLDLSVSKISRKSFVDTIENSDLIFVSVEPYTALSSKKLVDSIRSVNSQKKIIGYGTAVTLNPKIFTQIFDYVIPSGFYQDIVPKIINGKKLKYDNQQISLETPPSQLNWNSPLLEVLPVSEYDVISGGQLEINTQCGCLHNCSFCVEKRLFPKKAFYHRPPEQIRDFIESTGASKYYIDATTFSQDRSWCIDVCEKLSHIPRDFQWKTVTRIDCIDEEIAYWLNQGKCKQVSLGLETTSKRLQKSVRKNIEAEQVERAISLLQKNGITSRALLILGLPGQTAEDVNDTLEFVRNHNIPARWKEYQPLEKAAEFTKLEDFRVFERDGFFYHDIPGISKQQYMRILIEHARQL